MSYYVYRGMNGTFGYIKCRLVGKSGVDRHIMVDWSKRGGDPGENLVITNRGNVYEAEQDAKLAVFRRSIGFKKRHQYES